MYKISPEDPVAVENMRRKYVYFLGNFMGGNNDWRGGTLAEIHKATANKCIFPKEADFLLDFNNSPPPG